MVTGEQRLYASSEFEPSDHMACTVEMYNLSKECKSLFRIHSSFINMNAIATELDVLEDGIYPMYRSNRLIRRPYSYFHVS